MDGVEITFGVYWDVEEVCLLWVQRAVLALQERLVQARLHSCKKESQPSKHTRFLKHKGTIGITSMQSRGVCTYHTAMRH